MSDVFLNDPKNRGPKLLNRVAREQMKRRLLADVLVDLQICEIEGWDKMEYVKELFELMKGIVKSENAKNNRAGKTSVRYPDLFGGL